MLKEILKQKIDMKTLSTEGRKVIYDVDKFHSPKTKKDIRKVAHIMVLCKWIKEFEELGIEWSLIPNEEGFPVVIIKDEE